MTTLASLQSSVDQLAAEHERLIVQHRAFAAPLTDEAGPLAGPSFVSAFVQAGSASGGAAGRANLGAGLAIVGGVDYGQERYSGVAADDEVSAALALRFIPGDGPSRPYLEVGGAFAHVGRLTLTRAYADGSGIAIGQGQTSGDLTTFYARAGWIFGLGEKDELALFGEYAADRLGVGGYSEPLSNANPFEAQVAGAAARLQLGKLAVRYDHAFTDRWELGLTLGGARDFAVKDGIIAAIPGVGPLPPAPTGGSTWAEYGASLQYRITERTRAAFFVDGIAGSSRIGAATHAGVQLSATF